MVAETPLRTCILVLGMHRSGTSAVCGLLSEMGAERPLREMPPSPDNPKGYFEPQEIVTIHDRLLQSAGSHWADWDPLPSAWFGSACYEQYLDELTRAAREDFPGRGSFLVKDPRICRFVGIWIAVLKRIDCRPVVLFQYRDPMEVALSLKSREGFSVEQGLLLWLRHVLDAEESTRELKRSFVFYGAMLVDWRSELAPVLKALQPKLPRQSARAFSDVEEFIDGSLQHHRVKQASRSDMQDWVARALASLDLLRSDPYDENATKALDAIKQEFDRACLAFTPVLHGLARQVTKLQRERAAIDLDALQGRADQASHLEAEISTLRGHLAVLEPFKPRADLLEGEMEEARQAGVIAQTELAAVRLDLEAAHQAYAELLPLANKGPHLETALAEANIELAMLRPIAQAEPDLQAELNQLRQALAETNAELAVLRPIGLVEPSLQSELIELRKTVAGANVELGVLRPIGVAEPALQSELNQLRQELADHKEQLEVITTRLAQTIGVRLGGIFKRQRRS